MHPGGIQGHSGGWPNPSSRGMGSASRGGGLPQGGLPQGGWSASGGQTPLIMTSSGDHCSGWYASYWNVFLLIVDRSFQRCNSHHVHSCRSRETSGSDHIF